MSSSATGVGMPICFLGAILLILTQKSSQIFGDVLGIFYRCGFPFKHIWLCLWGGTYGRIRKDDTAPYYIKKSKGTVNTSNDGVLWLDGRNLFWGF